MAVGPRAAPTWRKGNTKMGSAIVRMKAFVLAIKRRTTGEHARPVRQAIQELEDMRKAGDKTLSINDLCELLIKEKQEVEEAAGKVRKVGNGKGRHCKRPRAEDVDPMDELGFAISQPQYALACLDPKPL